MVVKPKILIVRFSSIGDIVLTTPIIRCIKRQMPDSEVHFVTKASFAEVLKHNPYIDKLLVFEKDMNEIIPGLRTEKYHTIVDLHHNLRSMRLKLALGVRSYSFNKLNFQKFIAVNLKKINALPQKHIVDRYFETVKPLGVVNDGAGLDHFIGEEDLFSIKDKFSALNSSNYIALVAGGSYFTKQIPLNKLIEICSSSPKQFILLGGKADAAIGNELSKTCPNVINACGALTLNQSAFVLKGAECVISSDTGLMHIAAAFKKKIFSIWGNTVPEFGMYPYLPGEGSKQLEVKGLQCRPCSKLGYKKCPRGHFNCMNMIDIKEISL